MRRQFVLSSAPVDLNELRSRRLGGWWLYSGAEASVQLGSRVCLVGIAADVDSAEPVGVTDLERHLERDGLDVLIDYTDQLVGRFLIMVEDADRLLVIPDAWGSLQGFWADTSDGTRALSSSPGQLSQLGFGSTTSCDADRLPSEHAAKAVEYRSVGDICPISGTNRVRPNHVLDLSAGRRQRLPLRHREATFECVTAELGRAIVGLQLAHGGESWLPLTAGLDSRWLAWAASVAEADVRLFTFTPNTAPTADAAIGAKVADRLGAEHARIVLPENVSPLIKADVTAVRGAWRDLPKMTEIEYFSSLDKRVLVLNGNGGEIVRGGYYGSGPRPTTRRMVRSLCLGSHAPPFDREGFDRWFSSTAALPNRYDIGRDELFYWEERMSNWGSDFYAEKENYVDELSPFCSRRILRTGPALARGRSSIGVAQALADNRQLAGLPVNPHKSVNALRDLAYVKSFANLVRNALPSAPHPGADGHEETDLPQPSEHQTASREPAT